MAAKTILGIIGVITLLITSGVVVLKQSDYPLVDFSKPTYYCASLPPMNCDHLSSTGKTCYPSANTTKGGKSCSIKWELLKQPKVSRGVVCNLATGRCD